MIEWLKRKGLLVENENQIILQDMPTSKESNKNILQRLQKRR